MRKLKLEMEHLEVESFDTLTTKPRPEGTVMGHSTEPCAGTHDGWQCDTTQAAFVCTCTNGGYNNTTCDIHQSCGFERTQCNSICG